MRKPSHSFLHFHQSRMKRVRDTTTLISLSIGTPSTKGVTVYMESLTGLYTSVFTHL